MCAMKNARRSITRTVLFLFLILVGVCDAQQENRADHLGKQTVWEDFNSFTLQMTTAENSGYSLWQGQFDKDTNDIQVTVETSEAGKVVKGKLLMIAGRVM